MKPLLSIVIPTKDRYKYLKYLINLIDSFNSIEIELVLQDNTENNKEFVSYMDSKNYSFIRYAHRPEQIPVSLNCDLAILNATGEYICCIGDDDGVTKHIVDCVKWMKKLNVDVVVPDHLDYKWPCFISSSHYNVSGSLRYHDFDEKVKLVNPMESLYDIMKKGFINRGNLPLVYHGIVRKHVLDEIYKIGGTYFPGSSPDIANGVALCFFVKKFVTLNIPIIISGGSETHGGGVRKFKRGLANIEDIAFLPSNAKENWENNIPKVWTGETVWSESAIKALRYMGKDELISRVNFEYLLSQFILAHPTYLIEAIKLSENKCKLFYLLVKIGLVKYSKAILIRLRITKVDNGWNMIRNIDNIEQAHEFLIDIFPEFKIGELY